MAKSVAGRVLATITLVLAVLAIVDIVPPKALSVDASPDQFSAHRALEHLAVIAEQPHSMGTAEHERVRHYLAGQLEALGLEVDIQTDTILRQGWEPWPTVGRVNNIVARLKGQGGHRAVLLVSHHDTTPISPGAGDNSAGVAALLETLRALQASSKLRNDVIVLFSDGEEAGLLGADAFLRRHRWADDVGVVLNLEARGSRGPVLMFETSPGNRQMIGALRQAVDRPMAFSYSYEIYKVMPNDTDFSVFRRAGLPGMNFAFIHGPTAYHTALDSLQRLDLRSVQHHGEYALGLTRHFGNVDLNSGGTTGNAVYFNLLRPLFISYSVSWVLPLTLALTVGMIVFLGTGLRRGRLRIGGLLLAILANLLGAVVTGILLVLIARQAFVWFYSFSLWNGRSSLSMNLLALALIAVGVAILALRSVHGKLSEGSLIAGGLTVWLLLAVAMSVAAPGASYLFAWPLLFALAAGFLWLRGRSDEDTVARPLLALLALAAIVSALLWAPTLALVGAALGGPSSLLIGVFVFLLVFGLMTPHVILAVPQTRRWVLPVVTVGLGLVLLVAVRLGTGFDDANPKPNNIFYTLDADHSEARWLSIDRSTDVWTAQFLTETPERATLPAFLGRRQLPALASAAPVASLEGAAVEVLGEQETEGGHRLELAIDWPFDVHRAIVFLRSETEIRAISVDSQTSEWTSNTGPGEAPYRMAFSYSAPSPEGIRLDVELGEGAPMEIEIVGQRYGLPELAGFTYTRRPADKTPHQGSVTDSTYIHNVTTISPSVGSETGDLDVMEAANM